MPDSHFQQTSLQQPLLETADWLYVGMGAGDIEKFAPLMKEALHGALQCL